MTQLKTLSVDVLPHYPDALLPGYAHEGDSGFDLRAAISEPILITPGTTCMVPTGLRFDIPAGFEIQVRPRSGLAAKYGVTVVNAPGTVDAGFRGEVHVILTSLAEAYSVAPGDRIAQAVMSPVTEAVMYFTGELDESARGADGFGSTGTA